MLNRKIDMIISVQSVRKNAAARYNIYNDLRAEANWLKLANYSNVDPRLEAHGKYIYIICYYYTLLSLSLSLSTLSLLSLSLSLLSLSLLFSLLLL